MAKTPKKLVHWALDPSLSDFGSPFSAASTSDADSSSSLQYINAQLISHGFTYKPGLSLDGTSKEDADRTTAELQRTRTALQAIRSTHAAEIKKLEKEKERVLDKWSKLSDQQLKLNTVPSGLRFANAQVVEASDVQLRGKGKGFLEVATEQAQEARDALFNENRRLKGLLLSTANQIQRLLHNARSRTAAESLDEPPVITTVDFFPMSSTDAASDTFTSLLSGLKQSIDVLGEPNAAPNSASTSGPDPREFKKEKEREAKDKQEIDRLKRVVDTLRKELADSQKQTESYAAQTQQLFEKLAVEDRSTKEREPSVDLMTGPALDEERERLSRIGDELEEDRRKFTEAALKLGKEKAALEASSLCFFTLEINLIDYEGGKD
ncbi:hypothetical protein EIP86_006138 [Pleurotus ostreatoroseus]|nr:hypothetical protein EIP86_006138 [Pleurotus ostreatoroseus]